MIPEILAIALRRRDRSSAHGARATAGNGNALAQG